MAKRQRMGRPETPSDKRLSRQIMFRATQALANRLLKTAERYKVPVSAVVLDRLETGPLDASADFHRDVASALRIVGDWKKDRSAVKTLKEAISILLEAHEAQSVPKNLLDDSREETIEARVLAFSILQDSRHLWE